MILFLTSHQSHFICRLFSGVLTGQERERHFKRLIALHNYGIARVVEIMSKGGIKILQNE
jgi:hypothetical protein